MFVVKLFSLSDLLSLIRFFLFFLFFFLEGPAGSDQGVFERVPCLLPSDITINTHNQSNQIQSHSAHQPIIF